MERDFDSFVDGINFALAVIGDRTARMNTCVSYKETKKAWNERLIRNQESKGITNHLEYIMSSSSFKTWIKEYDDGKLWEFKEGV